MALSESSNLKAAEEVEREPSEKRPAEEKPFVAPPKHSFTTEFWVGVFFLIGLLALGYQAVGLGGMQLFGSNRYNIKAEFDNVAGLQTGAAVEIAGVGIGEVTGLELKDPEALITLSIDKHIAIREDDIASIRTKGIIGDRYIKISRGSSDALIEEGGTMFETESAVDLEDLIGKFVHSLESDDSE